MSHDYDYANEKIRFTKYEHAGRGLRYWVERVTPRPTNPTIDNPPGELLMGFGFTADHLRMWSVSEDIRFDGFANPTCCVGGMLIDPLTVRHCHPAARYQRRRVSLLTRWRWRKARAK